MRTQFSIKSVRYRTCHTLCAICAMTRCLTAIQTWTELGVVRSVHSNTPPRSNGLHSHALTGASDLGEILQRYRKIANSHRDCRHATLFQGRMVKTDT